MREINLIILHCSASDNKNHDSINVIRSWHFERGFSGVGYHYFIKSDGTIEKGRGEHIDGAHAKGFNKNSIGICLHGLKNFTDDQFISCAKLLKELMIRYNLKEIDIIHHNDVNKNKTCPNFNWLEKVRKYL